MKNTTLILSLLMFSIFSCFSKKTPSNNIEAWLEKEFPGQFQVLDSNLKMLDVMAQFKGEKRALIAERSDTLVQFSLDWKKNIPSLGLETEWVKGMDLSARNEVAKARQLFQDLQNSGLEQFSVGVHSESATIQVFTEPNPDNRLQTIERIKKGLDTRSASNPKTIYVELMEPTAYHTEFQDIIPFGHWETGIGWQRENKILSLEFDWNKSLKVSELMAYWELSPDSKRSGQYMDSSFIQAKAWAEKHLPKPYYLDDGQTIGYELSKLNPDGLEIKPHSPGIRLAFPYFDKEPTEEERAHLLEPKGYVVGMFFLDEQKFSGIRAQKEF